jgi:hypothetical protein
MNVREAGSGEDAPGRTSSWVFRWLGILWGAATVISLAKRGFAIDLRGLPQIFYEQYVWLRDMLFEPLVWVFKELSPSAKDALMFYGIIAATSSRMCVRYFREFHGRSATRYERTFYALFWPLVILNNMLAGLLLVEAFIIGCFAAAFFFWNHVQNVFGPS